MRDISDVEGVLAIGGSVLMIFVIIFVGLSAGYQHDKNLIAAINDNGCASHQPPAPGYKQRIETYNLNSLKGNN